MRNITDLNALSDNDLLLRLSRLVVQSRRVEADLVAHIGEVDKRRLFARESTSSMFVYCTQVLHLSEHEAYLRIAVARAARTYPVLLGMLCDGRLHLTAIAKIAALLDAVDETKREEILRRATHKSKREVEELVAALAPRPDVPSTIRKQLESPSPCAETIQPEHPASTGRPGRPLQPVEPAGTGQPVMPADSMPRTRSTRPGESVTIEPLAPERYKVTFTGSLELCEKLDRLRALMPDCDLAAIIEKAVSEKLALVEARRFGKTKAPRKSLDETDTSSGSRSIPAAVKRVVVERDGGQCTFVDTAGRRCQSQSRLEFHHDEPFALGGDRSPGNIRILCKTHNAFLAESTYGSRTIDRYRRKRKSPPGDPLPGELRSRGFAV